MPPDGAFTVLLLLVCGVSAVPVPPPTNVNVICQNAKVSVSWDYSKQQPLTVFMVSMSASSGDWKDREVNTTTDHRFDLSHFVWKSEKNYNGFMYVNVTALQGDGWSEGVESNSFSFNDLTLVKTRCPLGFPPVDVKEDESRTTVTFPNPVRFYEELERTVDPNAVFSYDVLPVKNDTEYFEPFKGECMVASDTCRLDVSFPEGVKKKCVRLKGTLFDSNGVNQLVFSETPEICARVSSEVHVVAVTAALFCILVVIIIAVVVCIYKVKAWKMDVDKTKPKLTIVEPGPRQLLLLEYKEDFSKVSVHEKQPTASEDDPGSNTSSDPPPPDAQYYSGRRLSESSDQELEDAKMIPEGSGTDDDSADDSVKTECVSLCSEEDRPEPVRNYDRPHTMIVKIGDGEMVTGYKGLEISFQRTSFGTEAALSDGFN